MQIRELIKAVKATPWHEGCIIELPYCHLPWGAPEIDELANALDDRDFTKAKVIWDPCAVEKGDEVSPEDYILKFLSKTALENVTFYCPADLKSDDVKAFADIRNIIAERNKINTESYKKFNQEYVPLNIQLELLDKNQTRSINVFRPLLTKLKNNTLRTQTIHFPTQVIHVGNYTTEDFNNDFIELLECGKFNKVLVEWQSLIIHPNTKLLLRMLASVVASFGKGVTQIEIRLPFGVSEKEASFMKTILNKIHEELKTSHPNNDLQFVLTFNHREDILRRSMAQSKKKNHLPFFMRKDVPSKLSQSVHADDEKENRMTV